MAREFHEGAILNLVQAARNLGLPVDETFQRTSGIFYDEWLNQIANGTPESTKVTATKNRALGLALTALIHSATAPELKTTDAPAVEESWPLRGDLRISPVEVAREIVTTALFSGRESVRNFLQAISDEWSGHPRLPEHKIGIGRLLLEECWGLGNYVLTDNQQPNYVNYQLLNAEIKRRMGVDFGDSIPNLQAFLEAITDYVVSPHRSTSATTAR